MKAKYKKFNQYFKRRHYSFEVGYRITKTRTGFLLGYSQISQKHSEKMKNIKRNKSGIKFWRNFHHRIKQKEQRLLRESQKQIKIFLDI